MRLPRMTTRRWMVAVAVIAWALGSAQLLMISRRHLARAALHANLSRRCLRLAEEHEAIYERTPTGWAIRGARDVRVPVAAGEPIGRLRTMGTWNWPTWEGADARTRAPHDSDEWREEAARHSRIQAEYERAAWMPWLPFEPDPPEPQ